MTPNDPLMTRATAWRLFGLALLVRVVFLLLSADSQIIQEGTLVRHLTIARSVQEGHGWQQESFPSKQIHGVTAAGKPYLLPVDAWPALRPDQLATPTPIDTVGFAALLATVWTVTGSRSLVPVQVLHVVLDSAAAVLLAWLVAALVGNRRLAVVAGVLYALLLPAARLAINPHRDAWAIWTGLAVLACAVRFEQTGRVRFLLGLAGTAVVGAWLRPTTVALFVPLVAVLWVVPAVSGRRVGLALAALATSLAVGFFAPFVAWNQQTYGRPFAVVSALGAWVAMGEYPNDHKAGNSDTAACQRVEELGYHGRPFTLEWDDVLGQEVARISAADPTLVWRNALRRLPQFAVSGFADVLEVPDHLRMTNYTATPGKSARTFLIDHPFWALARFGLAPLFWLTAAAGAVLLRRTWRQWLWLVVPAAWGIGYSALSHFETRNIVVTLWGPLVLVAAVVLAGWDAVRRRQRLKTDPA